MRAPGERIRGRRDLRFGTKFLLELVAILDVLARALLLDQPRQDAERRQLTRVRQHGIYG